MIEGYARWLSRYFRVPGHEPEDLAQEALVAAWLAPEGFERTAARRRVIDLLRAAQRRPQLCAPVEIESPVAVEDVVEARMRLGAVVTAPLTTNERVALGRVARGEPIARSEKALQVALWRARRRLA